jgi:streptogramin lyase
LAGRVVGGQQPVSGASILLYAAGSAGPGAGATNLLTTPVYTNAGGYFTISGYYTCPTPSTQVYIVSSGGNPGLTGSIDNSASVMMAALGNCSTLANSFININEVTTVGAAWALAQFLSPGAILGASPTNAIGLSNAFANANNLVNSSTGTAAGASLPAGATIESTKLYTLADVLSACVNSDGTTACNPLFQAATVGGVAPSNTLDAARNIVLNPGSNVTAIYNAAPTKVPFEPTLSGPPHDWTMSVTFTGGALNGPTALALDSQGNVWVANYSGGSASLFSPAGQPQSFSDPSLRESYGVAVDGQNNAWITNEESAYFTNNGYGSVTKFNSSGQVQSGAGFTAGGIYYPYAIAADSNGSIWVADFGDSTATLLAGNGASLSGGSGYTSTSNLPFPSSVALDAQHNAWFGAQSLASKVSPSGSIAGFSCCQSASAIAVDQAGDIWLADYSASSVVEVASNGSVLQTLPGTGGVYYPGGLAIDGSGNVWVTNYRGNTISGMTGANSGPTSTAISPSYGFGLDARLSQPFGLALDASGDVWVVSYANNAVVQFVGLASPIATPLLGPPAKP